MYQPFKHRDDLTSIFNAFVGESVAKNLVNVNAADADDANSETMAQVNELDTNIQNAQNEEEALQNLEAIFNLSCDMPTIVRYMLQKVRHIEEQFQNFSDLHDIITSESNAAMNNDDKET